MASVTLSEQVDCLTALGRLDEAAAQCREIIQQDEKQKHFRNVAVEKVKLANVHIFQKRYDDALTAYTEARTIFAAQNEPGSVAAAWHGIGIVCQYTGDYDAAEVAYRQALAIRVQNNLRSDQAVSLGQLGYLYADKLNRLEDAVTFFRQAADIFVALGDLRSEGVTRNNIANTLRALGRYAEARAEIERATECKRPFGHAAEPWKTFNILRQIEAAEGNAAAARAAWVQARDAYLAYRRQGGYA